MPVYEYEHTGKACGLGKVFDREQRMTDDSLKVCPSCGRRVKRNISTPSLNFPKGDSELKNMGFAKMVRRDTGVYENVTATGKESRIVKIGDRSTYPDLKSKIKD